MRKHRKDPFFRALQNYVTFFLLVAFIVSCCMMLFVSTLADSMGLVFTKENIADAAKRRPVTTPRRRIAHGGRRLQSF
jgi:uncharacterized membrane protein